MTKIDRRTILVTGGTRGIGAAIARHFASSGADVIATGTGPTKSEESDGDIRYMTVDFAEPASLDAFLGQIARLPRLDVCVNNAGINIIKPFPAVTSEDFDRLSAINFRAPFLVAQAAARVMQKAGQGWIINIASIWGVITKAGRSSYTAAKTGLVGMTRGLAIDLAPDGILVNSVSPGFVLTDLTRQSLSENEREELGAQVPLGRMASPDEIARVVAFLASPENTYLTGQNIIVDGGFTNV